MTENEKLLAEILKGVCKGAKDILFETWYAGLKIAILELRKSGFSDTDIIERILINGDILK